MAVEDEERRSILALASSNGATTPPPDDELTSLAWLQDTNLLKSFQMGSPYEEEVLSDDSAPSTTDSLLDEAGTVAIESSVAPTGGGGGGHHAPYNPTLHANSKPPFSFSCLIFMAIEDSLNKALPVKEIYNWILTHFPYFQNAPVGWKNSVRHNLSLSKCFRKVEKEKGQNVGKGSLWCIDPEFRPNLLQALQKAPSMANLEFSHFSYVSPSYYQNGKAESEIKPCLLVASQEALQIPSPELFPFLSRRLASSMKDPEVDAAATMLTLKNSPNINVSNISEESENDSVQFSQKFFRKRLRLKPASSHGAKRSRPSKPVITSSPSEDHTYSACLNQQDPKVEEAAAGNNNNSSPQKGSSPRRNRDETEGAQALMNLAEIASKRLLRKMNGKAS